MEVSATWVPDPANATNASYSIYDGDAATGTLLDTVTVDQTQAPAGTSDGNTQFQELGDYTSTTGTLTVVLDVSSANGTVVADSIGIAAAWASGGGQSQYEPEPSFQSNVQQSGNRTTPDVSFDGSINSGVDCYQGGMGSGYFGTSLSCPCWAGLIAIVNQGRVANGDDLSIPPIKRKPWKTFTICPPAISTILPMATPVGLPALVTIGSPDWVRHCQHSDSRFGRQSR